MGAAYYRAAHRRDDDAPLILDDPLAERLLGETVMKRFDDGLAGRDPERARALRAHFAIRSRLAEDTALAGRAEARTDCVVLGAGLDTFAWRHPGTPELTVWEIDHPDTQAWKRNRLAEVGLDEPSNLRFLPTDLAAAPLDALELPADATWNWLGVTVYLPKEAVAATLRAIAASGPKTTFVADFALAPEHCDPLGRAWRMRAAEFAASVGEPHIATYAPDEVRELLHHTGFTSVEVLGAADVSARYLQRRPEVRLGAATLFVVARRG